MQRRTVTIPNPQKLCKQRVTTLRCYLLGVNALALFGSKLRTQF